MHSTRSEPWNDRSSPWGNYRVRMRALLRDGDTAHRYRSRSEIVQALALAAVNAGWPFARLLWALRDRRNVGGLKVQEIGERVGDDAARRYVLRSFQKAEARARAPRNPGCRRRARGDCRPRQTCGSPALAGQGWRHGSRRLAGALRDRPPEGEPRPWRECSASRGTRRRLVADRVQGQRRLTKAGWLRRLQIGRGHEATTWRLRPGRCGTLTLITSGGREDEC